jgi:hypothetical protein
VTLVSQGVPYRIDKSTPPSIFTPPHEHPKWKCKINVFTFHIPPTPPRQFFFPLFFSLGRVFFSPSFFRKRVLAIAQWRKDSKKAQDVLPVRSSVSTSSSMEDVVIVGQSIGTTSSNTITPATACGLLEDVVIVGESISSTSSNTRRPAPVRTKNVQPTLDGHVISTTNAFLLDKSHAAVTEAGQNSAKKRKHLSAAFAGALCRAFERQTAKQKIRVAENMAQVQRDGQHATLKPSDVHLVVWRAPQTDDTSIYSISLYAVLGVSENASDTVIRES